jgi:flagellar hook-basal body complex protein FliE
MDPLSIQNTLRGLSGVGQLQPSPLASPELPLVAPGENSGLRLSELSEVQPGDNSRHAGHGPSFMETLSEYMKGVNDQVLKADERMAELASGKATNIPEALIKVQQADLQVRVLVETRNKIIRAYEEIMRMQA